jgi:hypothetical protein
VWGFQFKNSGDKLYIIDSLTIDESYIEQVLEGKDIIEIIDSLVNEETLRRY